MKQYTKLQKELSVVSKKRSNFLTTDWTHWKVPSTFRKIISLVMIISLMLGVTACGPNKKNQSHDETLGVEPGWKKDANTPVNFDWYVNFGWYTTAWGGNLVSDTITKETGVSINFISPVGNEREKLDALIASNNLPDIVTLGWWEPQINDMIDNDLVYALNELADQYDPYFFEVADPDVVNWYTKTDGKLYCYPNTAYTPKDVENNVKIGSNETFLVRKDIYEAIGSPDMTTTEGFEAAIKKAVQMYPTVNQQPLIPIGAAAFEETGCVSFELYLQNFLAIPHEVDGKVYDRYTDPEYIRWLKLFRKLGEEGYLTSDVFVDQRKQMEEKIVEGQYFCMLYQYTDMIDQEKILYTNKPDSIYIAVDGPKNKNGDDPVLPTAGINGWTVTLISKNCKAPDRAIEFLSYLMSEHGQKITSLGVEGVTYDVVDGKPVIKEEVASVLNSNRAEYDQIYGADNTYWMLQDNCMQMQWQQQATSPINELAEWSYPYSKYLAQYDYSFSEESEAGNAYRNIQKLWGKVLPRLLTAESEEQFDWLMEKFVDKREKLGYQLVKESMQQQMTEAKEKLGIE